MTAPIVITCIVVLYAMAVLIGYRTRKSRERKKPLTPNLTWKYPVLFKEGEIYKMHVGTNSYVKKPYYVVINRTGADFIETYIPERHTLLLRYGSPEWHYQVSRMEKIGVFQDCWRLLYNQVGLMDENPSPVIDRWKKPIEAGWLNSK